MMYLGMVSATFRKLSVEEIVKLCKDAKIDGIEWGSDVHVPKNDLEHAKYVKKLCDDNGIKIASYASYYFLGKNEENFADYIECAKVLGTKMIRVWPGKEESGTMSKERLDELIKEANEIATIAKEAGIEVSYEYHHVTLTDTLKSAQHLIDNTYNTKTHWQRPLDSTHEENIEQITALVHDIGNLHVNNRNPADGKYYPVREIKDKWEVYFDLMKPKKEDTFACVEFVQNESVEQFLDDVEVVRELINGMK